MKMDAQTRATVAGDDHQSIKSNEPDLLFLALARDTKEHR